MRVFFNAACCAGRAGGYSVGMKSGLMILMLSVLLAGAWTCDAQVDLPADDENVPTPLTLAELLPEGGIDAVDIDFWLHIKLTYQASRSGADRFMHWSARAVDGQLVFVIQTGRAEDSKPHSLATTVYSKEGKLVSFHEVSHEKGRKTSEVTSQIIDGQLKQTTTHYGDAGEVMYAESSILEPDVFKTTIPSEWFSLVAAYHIRNQSLGYRFARTDLHYRHQYAMTRLQDLGTEEVEFEGKTYTAHLLKGTRTFSSDTGDDAAELAYLIRPNGEMMYMRTLYYGIEFVGRRATEAQIRETFWLPPKPVEEGQDPAGKQ